MSDIVLQKRELRRQLRGAIRGITPGERKALSHATCALLREQKFWKSARSVLLYATLPDELDLLPLACEAIAEGKTVALPRYLPETCAYAAFVITNLDQDCAVGRFGIIEPRDFCPQIPLNRLDLVIVPGVGFDRHGYRLGRGRGFYDRVLAEVSGIKCGIAFDQQLTGGIPTESHDVRLDYILTPTRWLETSGSEHNLK